MCSDPSLGNLSDPLDGLALPEHRPEAIRDPRLVEVAVSDLGFLVAPQRIGDDRLLVRPQVQRAHEFFPGIATCSRATCSATATA